MNPIALVLSMFKSGGALPIAIAALIGVAVTTGEVSAQKQNGVGGKKGIVIFGEPKPKPKYVCFVADRSGSMAAGRKYFDYAANKIRYGKSSMGYLREQLIGITKKVLKNKKSRIHLMLYKSNTLVQPGPQWVGKKRDVDKVMKWLNGINPKGNSNPIGAFQKAFKLNPLPDEIYFMTDGMIDDPAFAKKLYALWNSSAATRKIKIYTVQIDVPGRDKASLMMSDWDRKLKTGVVKFVPPGILASIRILKNNHQNKLKDPAAKAKIIAAYKAQTELMSTIANLTGASSMYIKRFK